MLVYIKNDLITIPIWKNSSMSILAINIGLLNLAFLQTLLLLFCSAAPPAALELAQKKAVLRFPSLPAFIPEYYAAVCGLGIVAKHFCKLHIIRASL